MERSLIYRIHIGDIEGARNLIKEGFDVNNSDGYTNALYSTIEDERTEAFIMLIEEGADTNFMCVGDTPLHCAVHYNRPYYVKLLLENKANIDAVIKWCYHKENTALQDAAEYGFEECVRLLLDYGADIDIKNKDNLSAYDLAIKHGHENIANIILSHKFKNRKKAL